MSIRDFEEGGYAQEKGEKVAKEDSGLKYLGGPREASVINYGYCNRDSVGPRHQRYQYWLDRFYL